MLLHRHAFILILQYHNPQILDLFTQIDCAALLYLAYITPYQNRQIVGGIFVVLR